MNGLYHLHMHVIVHFTLGPAYGYRLWLSISSGFTIITNSILLLKLNHVKVIVFQKIARERVETVLQLNSYF